MNNFQRITTIKEALMLDIVRYEFRRAISDYNTDVILFEFSNEVSYAYHIDRKLRWENFESEEALINLFKEKAMMELAMTLASMWDWIDCLQYGQPCEVYFRPPDLRGKL